MSRKARDDRTTPAKRPDDEPADPRFTPTEWWQSGTCYPSQADGVPCPELETDCEICGRSGLNHEQCWRPGRDGDSE